MRINIYGKEYSLNSVDSLSIPLLQNCKAVIDEKGEGHGTEFSNI